MAGNFNPVSAIFRTVYFRNLQSIDRPEAVDFHPTSSGNFGGLNKWFFRWNHRFSFCQQACLKKSKKFKKCSTPQLVRFLNAPSSWFRWFSFRYLIRKRDGFQKILNSETIISRNFGNQLISEAAIILQKRAQQAGIDGSRSNWMLAKSRCWDNFGLHKSERFQ